jgi:hypothetical protein
MTSSSGFADTAAHVIAIIVIILVPIVGVTVFWLVHILPEKIAEKRHHPQKDAIKTLCLLSLVFGGMLWPLAWLWAYSRPVFHKMAYGTDKHEDFYALAGPMQEGVVPEAQEPQEAQRLREEIIHLRQRLAVLEGSDAAARPNEGIRSWKS